MTESSIKSANQTKFDVARKLNLPPGHWAITSSGPMGIRGLRVIGDVDIVVDNKLWAQLKAQYGVKEENGLIKIDVPQDLIDIVGEETFPATGASDPNKPSVDTQIRGADVIDDLPFVELKYIVYFKTQQGREKDKRDIEIIKEYLRLNSNS